MSELESVFAFGEKFSFNDKQTDLNQFYGGQDAKEVVMEKVVAMEDDDDVPRYLEQTERSGVNGWFDSFDFAKSKDFFTSRNNPQSPSYTNQPDHKETYDKQVTNNAKKRVFKGYQSTTTTMKPTKKKRRKFSSVVNKWRNLNSNSRPESSAVTPEVNNEPTDQQAELKSSWVSEELSDPGHWREERPAEDFREPTLDAAHSSEERSRLSRRPVARRPVTRRPVNRRPITRKPVSSSSSTAPTLAWAQPLQKTGGDWKMQVSQCFLYLHLILGTTGEHRDSAAAAPLHPPAPSGRRGRLL